MDEGWTSLLVSWLPVIVIMAVWFLVMSRYSRRNGSTNDLVRENTRAIEENTRAVVELAEALKQSRRA